MDTVFPFGFPAPTAFYLALYVFTWVLHAVFMQYCLAGALVLVWRVPRERPGPVAEVLRDWMPAGLSAAITAGVAPLLFVQVLYKLQFYTANLLLLHRWMSILGVLILGFYLYYLLKTSTLCRAAPLWRGIVACAAFACLAFTGYSWVENHQLSLQSQQAWSQHFADGRMWYRDAAMWPRFGLWFFTAWATWAALIGWQLCGRPEEDDVRATPVAVPALCGLAAATACWFVYAKMLGTHSDVLTSRVVLPYLIAAVCGGLLQIFAWSVMLRGRRLRRAPLGLASAGVLLMLVGLAVTREALRLSHIDITALYDQHAQAAAMGGWLVFGVFALINAGLITWCLRLVRRHTRVD